MVQGGGPLHQDEGNPSVLLCLGSMSCSHDFNFSGLEIGDFTLLPIRQARTGVGVLGLVGFCFPAPLCRLRLSTLILKRGRGVEELHQRMDVLHVYYLKITSQQLELHVFNSS